RAWRSCWLPSASICWATGCATRSTPACDAKTPTAAGLKLLSVPHGRLPRQAPMRGVAFIEHFHHRLQLLLGLSRVGNLRPCVDPGYPGVPGLKVLGVRT